MNLRCLFGFHKWIETHWVLKTIRPGEYQINYKCKRCGKIKGVWVKS
jgi:hypothetical protein